MKAIMISVICVSIILIGCGRSAVGLPESDVDQKKSSVFSLNHEKANRKTVEVLKDRKQMGAIPVSTATKMDYIMTEDISSGPEFDNSTNEGHWAGVYHDYQSNTLKVTDVNLKEKTFHFSLSVATVNECIGEINGKAKMISETTKARFMRDPQLGPCEIIFEFDKHRSIYIKEITCLDASGNQCILEGDYQK